MLNSELNSLIVETEGMKDESRHVIGKIYPPSTPDAPSHEKA